MHVIDKPDPFDFYSLSKINTYTRCSNFYKCRYILGMKVPSGPSTLLGSIVHTSLENLYTAVKEGGSVDKREVFKGAIKEVLVSKGFIEEPTWNEIGEEIFNCAAILRNAYLKASADYEGDDAIRTNSGSIAKCPEKTSAWKDFLRKRGKASNKELLDIALNAIELKNRFGRVSPTDVIGEAYNMFVNYTHPKCISSIRNIEYPISSYNKDRTKVLNPFKLPSSLVGDSEIYLMAFIDMVAELDDGGIIIIDHKTNKTQYDEKVIRVNTQLLLYSWVYEQITNEKVKYIGINNLRSNKLVYIPTPPEEYRWEIINCLFAAHKNIKDQQFVKHVPENYSPCLNSFGDLCPFLGYCWPGVAVDHGVSPIEYVPNIELTSDLDEEDDEILEL